MSFFCAEYDVGSYKETPITFSNISSVVPQSDSCISEVETHFIDLSNAEVKSVPELFTRLIDLLGKCSYSDLDNLWRSYVDCLDVSDVDHKRNLLQDNVFESNKSSKNQYALEHLASSAIVVNSLFVVSMFFLDALPNVHTDAALQLIADSATSSCLSDARYVWMTTQLIEWSSSGTDACQILMYILVSCYLCVRERDGSNMFYYFYRTWQEILQTQLGLIA